MIYQSRLSDPLTYRYPRTLQEVANRYACTGEEANAIHGPYSAEWETDTPVLVACGLAAVAMVVMALLGWL
jgi:hypothetical protein